MFDKGKHTYKSDIELGEKYRDTQTGYEGTAVAVYFFQHACERVSLETYDPTTKKVLDTTFDAPRLVLIKDETPVRQQRTGGPDRGEGARPDPSPR